VLAWTSRYPRGSGSESKATTGSSDRTGPTARSHGSLRRRCSGSDASVERRTQVPGPVSHTPRLDDSELHQETAVVVEASLAGDAAVLEREYKGACRGRPPT